MDFADLLTIHGFNPADVRLARHPASNLADSDNSEQTTYYSLWRNNREQWDLEIRTQYKKTFGNQHYVAHFIGLSSGDTVFTGMYQLLDFQIKDSGKSSEDPLVIWNHRKVDDFTQYEERLIISWQSTRAWCQIAGNTPKPIVAIEKSFSEPPFPGFDQFKMMSNERESLPETWKAVLSATKGVYLLVHDGTGTQYVGSAYGEGGFYARWENYADERNGHGGNKLLRQLETTIYHISILETCSSSDSAEDIIATESQWKEKLGSRAFGLNAN